MRLRAAFHVHSNWSYDGRWTLSQIAKEFKARGYDAVLMTEHDLGFSEELRRAHREACRQESTNDILLIPGVEYSDPSNTVHTLIWGNVPFLGAGRETTYVLQESQENGGVCVLAHPSRRGAWKVFSTEWTPYLAGIEVWNRKTDGWSPSPDGLRLAASTGVEQVVGLDFHSANQFFPLSMRIPIEGKVDEEGILNALKRRACSCDAMGVDLKRFSSSTFLLSSTRVLEVARRSAVRSVRFMRRYLPRTRSGEPAHPNESDKKTSSPSLSSGS